MVPATYRQSTPFNASENANAAISGGSNILDGDRDEALLSAASCWNADVYRLPPTQSGTLRKLSGHHFQTAFNFNESLIRFTRQQQAFSLLSFYPRFSDNKKHICLAHLVCNNIYRNRNDSFSLVIEYFHQSPVDLTLTPGQPVVLPSTVKALLWQWFTAKCADEHRRWLKWGPPWSRHNNLYFISFFILEAVAFRNIGNHFLGVLLFTILIWPPLGSAAVCRWKELTHLHTQLVDCSTYLRSHISLTKLFLCRPNLCFCSSSWLCLLHPLLAFAFITFISSSDILFPQNFGGAHKLFEPGSNLDFRTPACCCATY